MHHKIPNLFQSGIDKRHMTVFHWRTDKHHMPQHHQSIMQDMSNIFGLKNFMNPWSS